MERTGPVPFFLCLPKGDVGALECPRTPDTSVIPDDVAGMAKAYLNTSMAKMIVTQFHVIVRLWYSSGANPGLLLLWWGHIVARNL